MKRNLLLLVTFFMLSGCATTGPTTAELNNADYGPKPLFCHETIKEYYNTILVDSHSARFTFTEPRQGWAGPPITFGWEACGTVDARNSLGKYVGAKSFYMFFRDGKIVERHDDLTGDPVIKAVVDEKCSEQQKQ